MRMCGALRRMCGAVYGMCVYPHMPSYRLQHVHDRALFLSYEVDT